MIMTIPNPKSGLVNFSTQEELTVKDSPDSHTCVSIYEKECGEI
jgi:hypothetical protein